MKLNKDKSFILYIPRQSRGRKTKNNIDSGFIGDIKIVKETKYLGLILNNNLNFKTQLAIWNAKI